MSVYLSPPPVTTEAQRSSGAVASFGIYLHVLRQRKHFYIFYTELLLDIENSSTHMHIIMEKLLEQSLDVSDLVIW